MRVKKAAIAKEGSEESSEEGTAEGLVQRYFHEKGLEVDYTKASVFTTWALALYVT